MIILWSLVTVFTLAARSNLLSSLDGGQWRLQSIVVVWPPLHYRNHRSWRSPTIDNKFIEPNGQTGTLFTFQKIKPVWRINEFLSYFSGHLLIISFYLKNDDLKIRLYLPNFLYFLCLKSFQLLFLYLLELFKKRKSEKIMKRFQFFSIS